jgi:WD40 repeat protein
MAKPVRQDLCADTGEGVCSLSSHGDGLLRSSALSPNGNSVVTASTYMKSWEVDSGICLMVYHQEHLDPVSSIAWSRDGSSFFSTAFDGRALRWSPWSQQPHTHSSQLFRPDDEHGCCTDVEAAEDDKFLIVLSLLNIYVLDTTSPDSVLGKKRQVNAAKFYPS